MEEQGNLDSRWKLENRFYSGRTGNHETNENKTIKGVSSGSMGVKMAENTKEALASFKLKS